MPPVKRSALAATPNKNESVDRVSEFESFVTPRPQKFSRPSGKVSILIIVIILLIFSAWWFFGRNLHFNKSTVNNPEFKAIALDNGQIYYAQIVKKDDEMIYLTEVYYIQSEQRTVPAEEEGGEDQTVNVPVLVKRGQELHKPTGYLELNRDRVVGIETIGQDSEIYQEIQRLQAGGATQ